MSVYDTSTLYCPGCGIDGPMKRDKYKRPYWRCYMCGLTIFLRTTAAEGGFWVLQSIIGKNQKAYRAAAHHMATKLNREGTSGIPIRDESRASKKSAAKA
jgi:hypothetical protein